jgi:hypothetical protein
MPPHLNWGVSCSRPLDGSRNLAQFIRDTHAKVISSRPASTYSVLSLNRNINRGERVCVRVYKKAIFLFARTNELTLSLF